MSQQSTEQFYQLYLETMQKRADVDHSIAVLSWDKEIYMPSKGAAHRSQQIATLSGISHEIFTDPKFEETLRRLHDSNGELSPEEVRNVELTLEDYEKATKLGKDFVIRRSKAISNAYQAWLAARKDNSFVLFQDALDVVVQIKREQADILGYENHPYDALLDEFEPGCTTAILDPLFKDVRQKLVDFVAEIREQPQVDDRFLQQYFPQDQQWEYGINVLKNMGYDFDAGRQDISPHPFTVPFSSQDVRVTTRVDEENFATMIWSCIHEGGHALYEQGLSPEQYGLPLGTFVSLGIHESQSRLWENNVGRSLAYWKAHFPTLQLAFSEQLGEVSLEQFYKGINKIEPTFIRTESDELHYHFHILIRYEIEKGLIEGALQTADLEAIWNDNYKKYLDLDVPDANRGVLQDVHWSYGSFGYFPTYSLGSFYAAQFFRQAEQDIPNLIEQIERGDNSALLQWLRENIHQHGRRYSAEDLCTKITGEPLNFDHFYAYAKAKYKRIYGV